MMDNPANTVLESQGASRAPVEDAPPVAYTTSSEAQATGAQLQEVGPNAESRTAKNEGSSGREGLPLLLEVGCEEIPARFLADAERQFGERLQKALIETRLLIGQPDGAALREPAIGARGTRARRQSSLAPVTTFSTPRRLIAHVPSLRERQPNQTEDVIGPPVKVAFDAEGKPTRAAQSFAEKNQIGIQDLLQVETPKGLYVAAKRTTAGQSAVQVLSRLLPEVVAAMTFPKSMVWEESGVRFVRPIRWIIALLGEGNEAQTIAFEVAGVRSGSVTRSHRLTRKSEVAVTGFKDYMNRLRRGHVEIDPERRRKRVRQGIQKLLAPSGPLPVATPNPRDRNASPEIQVPNPWSGPGDPDPGPEVLAVIHESIPRASGPRPAGYGSGLEPETPAPSPRLQIVPDPALEDWIGASAEWPQPILGSFEPRFLELPREILITVMRDHQKYFALESKEPAGQGVSGEALEHSLVPGFVTVLNVAGDPEGIIRRGHERVLTARLEDANFFWHADQRIPLSQRLEKLERVTYHDKLGSYADKVKRMRGLAESICAELGARTELNPGQSENALRAVELCKCDLTTQMVQEFTELQGVVGGLYARAQGEQEEVWQAIYDHYKPVNIEDQCPRSLVGSVVSLADKLDAVIAGFAVGLEPSGSSDPFGLRRAGNGIVKIAIEATPGLDLYRLAIRTQEENKQFLEDRLTSGWKRVEAFLSERVAFYFESVARLRYDTVRAVLSPQVVDSWNVPSRSLARAQALETARDSGDFQAVAAAAKRTRNILTKSAKPEDFGAATSVSGELLRAPEEGELYSSFEAARAELAELEAKSDYAGGFHRLAKLRSVVDRFFDKVMVMDPDAAVRANRLRMLADLDALAFRRFADLSEIEARG
jgi:glycyl-tRNA synthetase beta chain